MWSGVCGKLHVNYCANSVALPCALCTAVLLVPSLTWNLHVGTPADGLRLVDSCNVSTTQQGLTFLHKKRSDYHIFRNGTINHGAREPPSAEGRFGGAEFKCELYGVAEQHCNDAPLGGTRS